MKNIVIKVLSFLLVVCMLVPISAIAIDNEAELTYTFEYNDRTIEIDATSLTYEEAERIADMIVYGDHSASTYGIFCIFGHKLEYTAAIETTHKEYAADPRCVRRAYRIEYCSRSSCSYSEATMTSAVRVSCCD